MQANGLLESIVKQGIGQIVQQQRTKPAPQPTRKPTPSPTVQTTAKYSSGTIREVQTLLSQLGYASGGADGVMGPNTRRAIRNFQRDRGMPRSGQVDDWLLTELRHAAGRNAAPTFGQPSFNCARAGNAAEHAICRSAELAMLDRQLAAAFKRARSGGGGSMLLQRQNHWIEARNRCQSDENCLAQSMRNRLVALGGGVAGTTATALSGAYVTPVQTGDAALSGADAYDYLLTSYIRANPELGNSDGFLGWFAGWNCSSKSFYRKQRLNPFEIEDAMAAARQTFAAVAALPPPVPPPMVELEVQLSVADYNMTTGTFPIALNAQGTTVAVRSSDYCNTLGRAQSPADTARFPRSFDITAADGRPFDAKMVQQLIGDLKFSRGEAEAFYEQGFPTIVVKIRGTVTEISPPGQYDIGIAKIQPENIIVRTHGSEKYSRILAVYGPKDIRIPQAETEQVEQVLLPFLDPAAVTIAYFKAHPEQLNNPEIASGLAYWDGKQGCTEEARSARNQFDQRRLLDAAPERAREMLASLHSPERFRVSYDVTLPKYDMDTQSYDISPRQRDPKRPEQFVTTLSNPYARRINHCVTNRGQVAVQSGVAVFVDNGVMDRLPLDAARAEALVSRQQRPTVTVELVVTPRGFNDQDSRWSQIEVQVNHVIFRDKATGEILYEREVEVLERGQASVWDTALSPDVANLLLRQLRLAPDAADNAGFSDIYGAATHCRELRAAAGNPIRTARLKKQVAEKLSALLTETAPQEQLFVIDFSQESLGQYNIETERFPFTPHGEYLSFYNKVAFISLPNSCSAFDSEKLPGAYRLTLTGADDLIAAGLPMEIEQAEEFIERYDGRKDGRERGVQIRVLATVDEFRTTPVLVQRNKKAMPAVAKFVAMRVIDPKDNSVIYEAGVTNVSLPAGAAQSSAQADPAAEQTAPSTKGTFALLTVSTGMGREEIEHALEEQLPDATASWDDPNVLSVEQGPCLFKPLDDPELTREAGSTCFIARFARDGGAASVMVRNVVAGQISEHVETALIKRFGAPADRRELPAGGVLLGWGAPLTAPAAELHRDVTAGQPLLQLEGRIYERQGVTVAILSLDADPAPAVADAKPAPAPAPAIKF
ncbi:peptidoglycan-binding protein [Neptunicoccus sediminis]|uniref:peptidoglycan-binding protein n=1 Tax=Neptunicoccus sediminis TaxID=1892596 RepID=UPI001FDFC084|nr:DUF4852 domain-containing protein [Neptunicoccus sediminis]